MSIAAAKRGRKRLAKGNRHLAKLRRPGVPKKISAELSARRLTEKINKAKAIQHRKGLSNKK